MEGAKPSSPSAEGEIDPAFSFDNFSFAPMVSKEKWLRTFVCFKTGRRGRRPLRCLCEGGRPMVAPTINAPEVSKRKVAKEFRLFQGGASRTSPPTMLVWAGHRKAIVVAPYDVCANNLLQILIYR